MRPVTRILEANEAADAAIKVVPASGRVMISQIASSDGGVSIERQPAYGRHAFRVTVPPATSAALALRIANGNMPPSIQAWAEPALIAYHRQLAIFIAATAGLMAAAVMIAFGQAAMSGRRAALWTALTLSGVLVAWLAANGVFDAGWDTAIGGPYGFAAMVVGLTLVAGLRLADEVAPISDLWPWASRYRRWVLAAIVLLSLFAFVGLPGAALSIDALVVLGVAAIAAYLVRRGAAGLRPARMLAPAAAIFALVAWAGALAALGVFHDNPTASTVIGGFAAAGAVLLALAMAMSDALAFAGLGRAGAEAVEARTPDAEAVPAALAAIGASHQGVFELDFRTDDLKLSADATTLIGIEDGDRVLAHSSWIGRIHPEDRALYREAFQDYRNHPGVAFRVEFRARSQSGRYPWLELRATMLGDGPHAERCLGLVADVTTRKEAEIEVVDQALHDPLTGLGNRIAALEALEGLGPRLDETVLALLDLDRFKQIHASLGDSGADAVLCHVAERLKARFEDAAEVFRVGGDSFALLFAAGTHEPVRVGAELVELCNAPLVENGRKIFAPASVGLASGRTAAAPLELLHNAELALREAKHQGGGCARLYSAELVGAMARDPVALEAELRRALAEGQIDVFYQPIIRLSDRTIAGFEALLRWHHPERGLVWPADFVTHSEQTGLIVTLGELALSRAAEDLARWQRYFPVEPPLFVSVNVSRRQLLDEAFEGRVAEVLARGALAAGSLRLEVTESAVAADENAERKLFRIRDLGASLAIDDFGMGLSNLSQLQDIPFDIVKIDKSFLAVHGGGDTDGHVILNSIIGLAHELNRGIVVEGVENEADAAWLAEMGCEYAQGFYFSVPLPAREAMNFIAMHFDAAGGGGAVAGQAQAQAD